MQKSVQNVKNSLKFKASPKSGILSVKVGVKKFAIPVDARMLSNGNYLFLSFAASSELYTISGKDLIAMPSEADATDAFHALNPGKRRGRRRREQVQMPAELEAALKNLPAGYKLGYGTDGSPKLVRARTRKKKNA
ncbi:MAG TPA: hypothetical protein VHE55_03655 [Fimbriimonadaceae bacterium]|nr:hypothetical protein [Fimbriimonadaceae bacterium]